MNKVILASASPRRKELLLKLGINFKVYPAILDEKKIIARTPKDTVLKISFEKANQISDIFPDKIVIGADTIVVYKNKILGKPKNKTEAIEMLKLLSNKTHYVLTGIAIIIKSKKFFLNDYEKTFVSIRKLSLKEIKDYIACGEYKDKAGAYAIQGKAKKFIKNIKGCYFNVVGLPENKFKEMLSLSFKSL